MTHLCRILNIKCHYIIWPGYWWVLRMQAAHSRYEDILRGAIEANGGFAYRTIGNAAQAALPTGRLAMPPKQH
jgi:hypothetical protein